ncbi:acyl-CoA dehydrogenase family protein [Conexibacter woesei]|uniref:Acyl-CoA dehydrogenase domain protein n=1 Tax=Conexibacter woesei (strain DSM 14684 / CCUG 47730 / CIP 108061 / JCM 11494 / NBRC 100937 / ID131577) TaxID=469383 RepID=D3F3R6_CONWI|nr:acyl-CoA dehydrogenase family protein [Conexibacter woesei]ADB52431.1 acyl-CoA dehydrogenase domain protein [Conexibacter woesei DSM 14684]
MRRDVFEDEHRWFRESVAGWIGHELMPVREQIREQRTIPRELWLSAGRQGFLGLGVAERHDGSGIEDFRFNAVFGEELARAGMAYASCFTIHTDVVAPYLIELATEEQQERWLPRFCSGELVTAIGLTEPDAGSDLAALRTSAARDGDGWVINGSKTFITNGLSADLVVVAARTSSGERGKGITLFAVEHGTPGFSRGAKLDKIGQVEADTGELFFEDARVPAENVIGEVDMGFRLMMERLPQERLSAACSNLAHAREALDQTLRYVDERRAFGRRIGSFQHIRFGIAELVTELDVTQAYVDRCLAAHAAGEFTAIDAAKVKWWSAEVQNRVLDACVQYHGGYGYMREYDVARAWTDARVTKIWAGSNEIMKEIIGRSLGLGEDRR